MTTHSNPEWIDGIPKHWPIARFKYAGQFQTGIDHKHLEPGDVPVYGSSETPFAYVNEVMSSGPAIAIGRKGTIDKPFMLMGNFWAVDTCMFNRILSPDFEIEYCFYVAMIVPWLDYSTKTALPSLTQTQVGNIPLPKPPIEEQHAIVSYLDRGTTHIDALVAKKTRFIELLREKRQALITHAVTKGLDAGVPMKNSGVEWLGEVPAHWDVFRFKLSTISCQNGLWGNDPNGKDDIECVRVADFNRPLLRINDDIPTLRAITQKERSGRLLRPGNLLLEKSGGGESQPVGQVVLYDRDAVAICSNFVAKIELAADMDYRFWNYHHHAAYVARINTRSIKQTSGIQNLDQHQYLSEMACFPPATEQRQIADYLDLATARIDALIAKTERSIELLREHRTSLITAAVTGKIDLRPAA